jgi:pSer/pThr/pTyr-binding forkhead associated (FHA) protein
MRGVRVEFRLPRGAMCSLGRSSSCTLQVKDPRISRQHCMLCFHGEALEVTDMGSANELQHVGERKSSLQLMPGDSFHACDTYFRFEAIERTPGDASSVAPVAEPAAPPAESRAEPAAEPPAEPTTWPGEPAIGDVVAGCRLLTLLGRS